MLSFFETFFACISAISTYSLTNTLFNFAMKRKELTFQTRKLMKAKQTAAKLEGLLSQLKDPASQEALAQDVKTAIENNDMDAFQKLLSEFVSYYPEVKKEA